MKILKAALVGRSLEHSISPKVHELLFDQVRKYSQSKFEKIEYAKIELTDQNALRSFLETSLQLNYRGINVTFPYKFFASNVPGKISATARRIHSANTILCGNPLRIISTDGAGFRFALEKCFPTRSFSDYTLTILGAGGAARAVLDVLSDDKWRSMNVAARSTLEAEKLAAIFRNINALSMDGLDRKKLSRDNTKHFIVQATPVGQRSRESLLEQFEWHPEDVAVDVVYNPLITRFLDCAHSAGAIIMDGLGMLIEQAALAQHFWMTEQESECSILSEREFFNLHASLATFLTAKWDAFAI